MDSMRSVLMMLGVVLHSANVFIPEQSWLIYSERTTPVATLLVEAIHAFRMPAFFVVSGFFCALTIGKYKAKKFAEIRLKRIAIPLLVTALTFNSVQAYFLNTSGFRIFNAKDYFLDGGWVSHLWFLNNLIIYFSVAALLAWFLETPIRKLGNFIASIFTKIPLFLIVLFMPLTAIIILASNKIGFPLYSSLLGVFNTYDLLIYAPFFVFGSILAANIQLLYRFATINPVVSIPVVIACEYFSAFFPSDNRVTALVVNTYLNFLATWFLITLCFYLFHLFFNRQSSMWRFLSDASYSVYLFHHLFVVLVGYIIIQLPLNPLLSLSLLICIVGTITICMHKYLVMRIPVLSFLYNGK